MKKLLKISIIVLFAFLIQILIGCGEDSKEQKAATNESVNIKLDDKAKAFGIKLSDNKDFSNPQDSFIEQRVEISDTTFANIKYKEAFNANGKLQDHTFFAYTLYVKNGGNKASTIEIDVDSGNVTRSCDRAIRISIIEEGNVDDTNNISFSKGAIFLKNDGHGDEILIEKLNEEPEKKAFYDRFAKEFFTNDEHFGNFSIENIGVNEIKKVTIIIWFEGWDLDDTNEIITGQMELSFVFSVNE